MWGQVISVLVKLRAIRSGNKIVILRVQTGWVLCCPGQIAYTSDETLTPAHRAYISLILGELSVHEVSKALYVSDDQRYGFQNQIPGTEDCGAVGS